MVAAEKIWLASGNGILRLDWKVLRVMRVLGVNLQEGGGWGADWKRGVHEWQIKLSLKKAAILHTKHF